MHTLLIIVALYFLSIHSVFSWKLDTKEDLNVINLGEDEVGLFGYGSLMLPESFAESLYRPYDGPFLPCKLRDFKRTWTAGYKCWGGEDDCSCPDKKGATAMVDFVTFLNIEKSLGNQINGILTVIKKEELQEFDLREHGYDRIDVTELLERIQVREGRVYAYSAKQKNIITDITMAGVSVDYLQVIQEALEFLGEDFTQEYYRTTGPLPRLCYPLQLEESIAEAISVILEENKEITIFPIDYRRFDFTFITCLDCNPKALEQLIELLEKGGAEYFINNTGLHQD